MTPRRLAAAFAAGVIAVLLLGVYGDETIIPLDSVSGAAISIDFQHHELHEGDSFSVIYSVVDLGAMTTPNDMITLDFTTPNTTKWGHFLFSASGSADWRVRLIEAPSGGAATPTGQFTILNKNRNSATTSTFIGSAAGNVNYDATLATGGTTLWDQYLEGSGGPMAGGTSGGSRNERILKQNTKYQVSLFGADANPATLQITWYEHTSR